MERPLAPISMWAATMSKSEEETLK